MESLDMMSLFKVAEVELIYKSGRNCDEKIFISDAQSAYDALINTWDLNKIELVEQFKIVLLNRDLSCIGISEISYGGMAACIVDPKVVFATALKARATSIILAHNHPSENLTPSQHDIILTNKLVQGGKILDIVVADSLTLSKRSFCSMANEGIMFV